MSFLCMTINKVVDYDRCINECQYIFKSACIDKINEGYQQGRADERPKAFAKGYDSGYQKGRADAIEELKPSADMVAYEQGRLDALDHCEKCETDQWDALYKAEMKGRLEGIDAFFKALIRDNLIHNENDLIIASMLAEQLKEQNAR